MTMLIPYLPLTQQSALFLSCGCYFVYLTRFEVEFKDCVVYDIQELAQQEDMG